MSSLDKVKSILKIEWRSGEKWCEIVCEDVHDPQWAQAAAVPADMIHRFQNNIVDIEVEQVQLEHEDQKLMISAQQNIKKEILNIVVIDDSPQLQAKYEQAHSDQEILQHDEYEEQNYSYQSERDDDTSSLQIKQSGEEQFGEYRPLGSMIGSKNKKKIKFAKIGNLYISKNKTKNIQKQPISRRIIDRSAVNSDNILLQRFRDVGAKNYKEHIPEPKVEAINKNKTKIERIELIKKIQRCKENEEALIQHVVSSHQLGHQKYFCVKLSNGQECMILESHMNRFFPNKLTIYYENIIQQMTSQFLVHN